jgi:7-cyano-7-deazaguanine synthase
MSGSALVLFSGGQDSTTCLAWALARFSHVETVGFAYGQRQAAEMDARPKILKSLHRRFPAWSAKLKDDHVLPLDVFKAIGGNALTEDMKIEVRAHALPTTFVPGRNIMFLAAAASLAYRRGIVDLVGGMCETDYSGYPDCRNDTIKAMEVTLDLALEKKMVIHTPLMHIDKAETWELAHKIGGKALVDLIVEETVSCYEGDRKTRHDWGYGCGACPACDLRAKGYAGYMRP